MATSRYSQRFPAQCPQVRTARATAPAAEGVVRENTRRAPGVCHQAEEALGVLLIALAVEVEEGHLAALGHGVGEAQPVSVLPLPVAPHTSRCQHRRAGERSCFYRTLRQKRSAGSLPARQRSTFAKGPLSAATARISRAGLTGARPPDLTGTFSSKSDRNAVTERTRPDSGVPEGGQSSVSGHVMRASCRSGTFGELANGVGASAGRLTGG